MSKILNLKVDFTCSSCADKITAFLQQLNLDDFTIDIVSKTVEIEYDSAVISENEILKAFSTNGFKYELI